MKKTIAPLIVSSVALLTAVACSHVLVNVEPSAAKAELPKVMSVTTGFLKDKGKKFDIQLTIRNLSAKSEIVWLKDILCARGTQTGEVTMVNARHGDMPIVWRADESKVLILTCTYGGEVRGSFMVNISKIMDNPSEDGRTSVKTIGANLKLEHADNGPAYR